MSYTLQQVATLTGAQIFGTTNPTIEWLLTDSRSLAYPETSLFFALHTRTGDGHRYIDGLYHRGVRSFVVGVLPDHYAAQYPEATFLLTASPLKALQLLAEQHRRRFDIPVVGITGSNGKTIVKEWIYQLLDHAPTVTRTPRSYNSQVGVPLSVWLLNERSRLGVFEAGISQPREMSALRHIIRPTLGVLTNIGPAHQENFATLEEKCLEKLKLFKHADALVYNADNELIVRCLAEADFAGERISWSRHSSRAAYTFKVHPEGDSTRIVCHHVGQPLCDFHIPFSDEASIENAITAFVTVCSLPSEALPLPALHELGERMAQLQP
ncbi:MAG: bifunctional UDP-N-acetylmuramoyl-tripeptide:D-alanyl-D-alanine ligase/alanine racemase, partial [Alloprevotella sp.]